MAAAVKTNKSADLVRQLRSRFLEEYEKNKDEDMYDPRDLVLIEDDWYVKRFLLARNRNVDQAYEMLVSALRWRCDNYISETRDFHFPSEFYQIGGLFVYERDRFNNVVMFMRVKYHKKVPELDEPTKGFLVHTFNKAEKMAKGQGFAMIFDLEGAGLGQADIPFLNFLVDFGRNFFPGSIKYILVYNLPWILSAVQKIAFAMIPQEFLGLIKFARGRDIFEYIAPENCPDYVPGATCRRNYRAVAPGSMPVSNLMASYGYSQADYDRIFPTFKKDLDAANKALSQGNYLPPPEDFWDPIDGVEITPLPMPSQRVRQPKRATLTPPLASESLVVIYPDDLVISFFPGQDGRPVAELDLTNSRDQPVAFKVQSNNPKLFVVSPRHGILLPRTSIRCTLVSLTTTVTTSDKFLVLALPVTKTQFPMAEFSQLWSSRRNETECHKLTTAVVSKDAMATDDHEPDIGHMVNQIRRQCSKLAANQSRQLALIAILLLVISLLLIVILVDHIYDITLTDIYNSGTRVLTDLVVKGRPVKLGAKK
ncbi:Motile sperm domain-containing protein 2 [Halotydeus destructor]|nr:Motile sperm domain-containing protein 2 [Halotydeus destructor]